jgi:putative endonuclease
MALEHLSRSGLWLESRNYRGPRGEIDLVMRDGEVLVFVEVRFRSDERFGDGAETVDGRKRARLRATAAHYLQTHPRLGSHPCRFDVVAVAPDRVDWIPDAFAG